MQTTILRFFHLIFYYQIRSLILSNCPVAGKNRHRFTTGLEIEIEIKKCHLILQLQQEIIPCVISSGMRSAAAAGEIRGNQADGWEAEDRAKRVPPLVSIPPSFVSLPIDC